MSSERQKKVAPHYQPLWQLGDLYICNGPRGLRAIPYQQHGTPRAEDLQAWYDGGIPVRALAAAAEAAKFLGDEYELEASK
jgi:hypothetical protein